MLVGTGSESPKSHYIIVEPHSRLASFGSCMNFEMAIAIFATTILCKPIYFQFYEPTSIGKDIFFISDFKVSFLCLRSQEQLGLEACKISSAREYSENNVHRYCGSLSLSCLGLLWCD